MARKSQRGAYSGLRSGSRHMNARRELLARGEVQNCWRCGKTLYASAPRGHERFITLGHVVALEDGGAAYDPRNHAPECGPCNFSDGARRTNRKRWGYTASPGDDLHTQYQNSRWYGPPMVFDETIDTAVPNGCQICSAPKNAGGVYCSAECRTEAAARRSRDAYRKRMGIMVDPHQPTKPHANSSRSFSARTLADRDLQKTVGATPHPIAREVA